MCKQKIAGYLCKAMFFAWCVGMVTVVIGNLGEGAVLVQQKSRDAQKKKCSNPSILNCGEREKKEEKSIKSKDTPRPKPTLFARSATISSIINFDKAVGGRIEWPRPDIGAVAQNAGFFALYNQFQLETKSPERFVIQLQTSKPSKSWKILLSADGQKYEDLPLTLSGYPNSGYVLDTSRITAPGGSQYYIEVRYTDVAATNVGIVEPYSLLVSKIGTITITGGDSAELSEQNARKIPLPSGQVTYFKEYLFDSVSKGGLYSIELSPNKTNLDFEILSEVNGNKLELSPKNIERGDVSDVPLADDGRYLIRILYRNASKQQSEIPYEIKFRSQQFARADYLSETQKLINAFKGYSQCEGVIKGLESLTRTNPKDPEAYLELGKTQWLCGREDQAYREIEKAFSLGGILSFEVVHRSDCEDRLDNGNVNQEVTRRKKVQLKIQKGRVEVETCKRLTGQQATARSDGLDLILRVELIDGSKKVFYFAPTSLEQRQTKMIAAFIKRFAS